MLSERGKEISFFHSKPLQYLRKKKNEILKIESMFRATSSKFTYYMLRMFVGKKIQAHQ